MKKLKKLELSPMQMTDEELKNILGGAYDNEECSSTSGGGCASGCKAGCTTCKPGCSSSK